MYTYIKFTKASEAEEEEIPEEEVAPEEAYNRIV